MALTKLMKKRELDLKKKALADLTRSGEAFETREAELEAAIEEVETQEQRDAVMAEIEAFEAEKADHNEKKSKLEEEIRALEAEIDELEAKDKAAPVQEPEERKEIVTMETRKFFNMSAQERDAMFAREDVKAFLGETRTAIREKRALTNVGLTIPEVFLGILRENIQNYSKLYKHVYVRTLSGEGRMVIMGTIPEAVWTDCCANLNELSLTFNDVEIGCWRVGGYYAVCNANLEDSDVNLASEIITALGQGIGLALDKAILYGTGTRMPLGVVTRLVQTAAPADYPATARAWADLHTSNVFNLTTTGKSAAEILAAIVSASGNAKGRYSRGEKVWCMNETTYTFLMSTLIATNANGTYVTSVQGTMPVAGGVIEVLDFIPNGVIIEGYFDLYLLAERAGQKFAQSEHVRFLQDQTVFRGTARYDGQPAIAEGFVAIGFDTTPTATAVTFAADTAN